MAGRASVPIFSNARYVLDAVIMTEALSNA